MSESARLVLERMEPDRRYHAQELRAVVPDAGVERLREIMHELWLHRQVERAGDSAWRRRQSASPHATRATAGDPASVTPEELFDHAAFADFFK